MLVVGDNPLSELAAGRALGATTVQTVRPGVEPWPRQTTGWRGYKACWPCCRRTHRAPQRRICPQQAQTTGFERNRCQALVQYALIAIEYVANHDCAASAPRRIGRDHGRQSAPTLADLARFSP
ncbi:MAG: hypothetical protein U1E74_08000 [Paenacidovorax caeni]